MMIDINLSSNNIVLELLLNQILDIVSSKKKCMLILDSVFASNSSSISNIVQCSSQYLKMVYCFDDLMSLRIYSEKEITCAISNCSKCFIFKHVSIESCKKWSEYIGEYDKKQLNYTNSVSSDFTTSYQSSINNCREWRVKPEEIRELSKGEVFLIDNMNNELIFTEII